MLEIDAPEESKWPLHKRRDKLREMLRRDHPEIFDEQKHLDDSPERTYWHYGYLMALDDILRQTGKARIITELAQILPVAEKLT